MADAAVVAAAATAASAAAASAAAAAERVTKSPDDAISSRALLDSLRFTSLSFERWLRLRAS